MEAVHGHVDPKHVGAELAEPFDVGADPAPHVQDPPILQRDVPPDELEATLLDRLIRRAPSPASPSAR